MSLPEDERSNILVNVRMRPSIRCLSANYASLFSLVLGFAHGRRFTGQSVGRRHTFGLASSVGAACW